MQKDAVIEKKRRRLYWPDAKWQAVNYAVSDFFHR